MAGEAPAQATLRDTLTQAVEAEEAKQVTPVETPVAAEPAAAAPETPEQKAGRTAGRERDELGRLLPGPAKKEPELAPAAAQAATAVPATPAIPRPSSWEKGMWGIWDKLNAGAALDAKEARQLAEYSNKRESDFAKGVSTYKQEWDRAKPLMDALAPYQGVLQQRNIQPQQWIENMARAEHALLTGSPEQKLSMFLKLAQDYQIPVQSLFVQGQDGKVYYNPQVQPHQPPQQRPQQDVRQTVQEILSQERASQELARFESEAPTKYQHYEAVKADMARLLETGFTETLESAYDTALRLPKHAELFTQAQQAKDEEAKAEQVRKSQEQAQRARANAVSPRSSTPAGTGAKASPRSVRESIEAATELHLNTGRV